MKKVVLVEPIKGTPGSDYYVRSCSLPESGGSMEIREPIAIEYIAAYVQQAGYEAKVIQQRGMSDEYLVKEIIKEKPFVVGFSVLTYNFYDSLSLARKIKLVNPNIVIVFGGYQPTGDPSILKDKVIDYVVIGEGEATFLDLLDFLTHEGDVTKIKGIAYWSGDLKVNEIRERLDVNSLPWPVREKSLLKDCAHSGLTYPPPPKQISAAQVTYSRGCPFDCSFCASPLLWRRKLSFRSAVDVVSEIKYLKETYGTNFVFFTDLTFNIDRKKVFEICQELITRNVKVNWFAMVNLDIDFETAEIMKDSGCSVLGFGIEALVSRSLNEVKSYQDLDMIKETLENTDSVGISNRCYLMMGYPWETRETLGETLTQLKKLPIDSLRMNFIAPFPGTKYFNDWKERLSPNLSKFHGQEPVVSCDNLTEKELVEIRDKIVKEFFNSRQYKKRSINKIKRFPYWRESYIYYQNYLVESGILDPENLWIKDDSYGVGKKSADNLKRAGLA